MTDNISAILAERGKTHGKFSDHARISQGLKTKMRSEPNWANLTDGQRETLEMNAHKIGRILAGNPDFEDHWDDIAGYAKLISKDIAERRALAEAHPISELVDRARGR